MIEPKDGFRSQAKRRHSTQILVNWMFALAWIIHDFAGEKRKGALKG
jgi:hypothetical protein